MQETDPLGYLMPGGQPDPNDPQAIARWIADTNADQGGAVPNDTGFDPPEGDQEMLPMGGNSPVGGPPSGPQYPGEWGGFMSDPANRAFLINAGIQLMSGGWGGWGAQVGRALAAGFQGAHAAERDAQGLPPVGLPRDGTSRGGAPRGRGGPLRPSSRARPRGVDSNPEVAQQAQAAVSQLTQVQEFLANPNVTEAEFAQQAQPGGLIHQAFGPAAQFGKKQEYLVQVQSRIERLLPSTRGSGQSISAEELTRLGMSTNPIDQMEFQVQASRFMRRSPGAGYRWRIDPSTGLLDREPMSSGGPPGSRGGRVTSSEHARNARAAMQSGLGLLDDISEALANTTGVDRFASNITGFGTWATIRPQLNVVSRALMHGLSGANVTLPETQAYLEAFMPNPNRPADWSLERVEYRLNHARSLMMSMLSAGENPISEEVRMGVVNSMRKYLGLPELNPEQYLLRLQRYGIPTGPLGDLGAPSRAAPQTPPATPPARTAPPTLGPATPSPAPLAPEMDFELGPDGVWRRKAR